MSARNPIKSNLYPTPTKATDVKTARNMLIWTSDSVALSRAVVAVDADVAAVEEAEDVVVAVGHAASTHLTRTK